MKTRSFLIATTAALTLTAPASAQLLGGGLGRITGGLSQSVSGAIDGRVASSVDRSIDRRSGRASAGASADGALGGTLDSVTGVTGPSGASASKSLRAEKRVSKSASVQADGPGTDDAAGLVGSVASTARGAAAGTATTAQGLAGGAVAGSATGSGASSGGASAGGGTLAGSGALAGSTGAEGALGVGTLVRDAKGRAVGRVQAIHDEAQTVLVGVGDRSVELPSNALSVNGEFATAAMSRAEIRKMAKEQPQAQP